MSGSRQVTLLVSALFGIGLLLVTEDCLAQGVQLPLVGQLPQVVNSYLTPAGPSCPVEPEVPGALRQRLQPCPEVGHLFVPKAEFPGVVQKLLEHRLGEFAALTPEKMAEQTLSRSTPEREPLMASDPICQNEEAWAKLGAREKWQRCPGVPAFLVLDAAGNQEHQSAGRFKRWGRNLSDLRNPIPADFDLKDVSLRELQMGGAISVRRVTERELIKERMGHERTTPITPIFPLGPSRTQAQIDQEIQEQLDRTTSQIMTEYEIDIPIAAFRLRTGIEVKPAGFAKEKIQKEKLMDVKSAELALNPAAAGRPMHVKLRVAVNRIGHVLLTKATSSGGDQVSQIDMPTEGLFLSYAGVQSPIQGDRLRDQALSPKTKAEKLKDFGSEQDADNFTWLANFFNHKGISSFKVKQTLGSYLPGLLGNALVNCLNSYAKIQKNPIRLPVSISGLMSTVSGNEWLLKSLLGDAHRSLEAFKLSLRDLVTKDPLARLVGGAKKPDPCDHEVYRETYHKTLAELGHLKDYLGKVDKAISETPTSYFLDEYRFILQELLREQDLLAQLAEKSSGKAIPACKELGKGRPSVPAEVTALISSANDRLSRIQRKFTAQQTEIVIKTFVSEYRDTIAIRFYEESDLNSNCVAEESPSEAELASHSSCLNLNTEPINRLFRRIHDSKVLDFCFGYDLSKNQEKGCSEASLTDLKLHIAFKEPPQLKWDAEKATHYIDFQTVEIDPTGIAALAKPLLPNRIGGRVYFDVRGCNSTEGTNSLCFSTQLQAQATRGVLHQKILDKIVKELEFGTKVHSDLMEKVIKAINPYLNEKLKKSTIPVAPFHAHPRQEENKFTLCFH